MDAEHVARLDQMVTDGEDQSHILELFRFYKYSDEEIMREIVLAEQKAKLPQKKTAQSPGFATSAMTGRESTYHKPKEHHKGINWLHIVWVIFGLVILGAIGYYVYSTSTPLGEAPSKILPSITVVPLNCSETSALLNIYNPSLERTGEVDLSILENNAACARADLQANLKIETRCAGNFTSGETYSLISGIFKPEVFRCP